MSNVYARFVVDTQSKNQKKKLTRFQSSFVLTIVVRTWRILKNIFAIFCFITSKKGRKQLKQGKSLRRVYGRNVKKRQCQNWFARFRDSDFLVKAHCSDRPSKIDDDEMKALVQANKHSTVRKLAAALKVSVGSVHGHLKSLGFVKKLDVWVPHELKEIHLTNRMNVYDQFIKREENDPFLKCMGDEKWIVYNNQSLFTTTMLVEKEVGVGEVKHRKDKQRRSTKR